MSIITDEMVAVARRAFSAAFVAAGDGQCALTAALAAVAPLIAKAEREACARVAEEKRDGLERCAHRRQEMEVFAYMVRATDAGDIAAAIRALKEAT